METNKKTIIISGIFNALYPLLGILFFVLGVDVVAYICAGIGTLFALTRMAQRDFWPTGWIICCVISSAITYKQVHIGFWPLAAVLICAYSFVAFVIDTVKLIRINRYAKSLREDATKSEFDDPSYVAVNILDSSGGLSMEELMFTDEDSPEPLYRRMEKWLIGEDISYEEYINLRDPGTNQMYLIIFFDQGEKKYHFVTKSAWDRFASRIESLLSQSDL